MATLKSLAKGFIKLSYCRLLKKRFPLNVFFVITNNCNLKCDYCYGEYYNRKHFREFTTDEILLTLEELRRLGTVFLQLQGGEPLLRKDIHQIVNRAKELKFSLDMITNGLLVKNKIETVKLLDSICISLDGLKGSNDFNRGSGIFEKTIEAIMLCSENKIPTRLNSIITNKTTPADIDFLMDLSKKNNCLLNFCPTFEFKPLTADKSYSYFNYNREKYNEIIELIIDYKKKKYPVQFTAAAYEISKRWPFSLEKRRAEISEIPKEYYTPKCFHGDYVCFIDSDGRLYPCCNFWNDFDDLNIHTLGFENAWNKLTRKNCSACYIYSYIDRNLLMNLNFSTLKNYFFNALNIKMF